MKQYIIWMVLVMWSCSDGDHSGLDLENPRIKSALEKRKATYAQEILENCKREILDKAELYVDSVISAEINFQLSDSIVFPEKPIKPDWPGPIVVSETIKAKPIFKSRKLLLQRPPEK